MTKEEAIHVINQVRDVITKDPSWMEEATRVVNEAADMAIKALEAQEWIPCSERLPENKSYVLTTIYIPGRQPHARSGWFEDGLFMNDNGDTWKSTDREVCAWMPLPEPYREGEE